VEPPLELLVERGPRVDDAGGVRLAERVETLMHERMAVRPRVEVVPAGTLERTAHKTSLVERRY